MTAEETVRRISNEESRRNVLTGIAHHLEDAIADIDLTIVADVGIQAHDIVIRLRPTQATKLLDHLRHHAHST